MTEFGRGGRLRARSGKERHQIIGTAVEIINRHKIFSLASCVNNDEYKSLFSPATKAQHSQYKLCFLLVAPANGRMADFNGYGDQISFVMDKGNARANDNEADSVDTRLDRQSGNNNRRG